MKKYYIISLLIFLAFSFSSCLKDKNIEDQKYGMKGLEDIKLVELTDAPSQTINLVSSNTDTTFAIVTVHLNSENPAGKDITVTLEADQALLDEYNEENETDYEVPPSSIYSFDNLTVTIPKGSREGSVNITTKSADLSGGNYAFAFSIASISDPSYVLSKNYKNIVTIVGVKNKYDGKYTVTGTMTDFAPGTTFSGLYPATYYLITQGSNSVAMFDPVYFGDYIHTMRNGGSISGFGSFSPMFTFDDEGNVTKVENAYGVPSNTRVAEIDPSGINKIDANGTIKVKYWMNQPSVMPGHRISFDETFTYVGPR